MACREHDGVPGGGSRGGGRCSVCAVALVTDYDAGVDGHVPVTMDAVFAMMRSNVAQVRELIAAAIGDLREVTGL